MAWNCWIQRWRKTTIFDLILNFYQPQSGQITVDGEPVQNISLKTLRTKITKISQEVLLFPGTICENLLLANPQATEEEIQNAIEVASLDGFIHSLQRLDLIGKYRGNTIGLKELIQHICEDAEEQTRLLSDKDRELFEDILANTISKKIRTKIYASKRWVEKMNELMEGMQIAQRLKQRYGEKIILWNYRVDWYRMYLSDVTLDGTRLKKLDKIYLNELSELKEAMQKEQRATYQETMLELLLE